MMISSRKPEIRTIKNVPHKLCTGKHGCQEWLPTSNFWEKKQVVSGRRVVTGYNTYCKSCDKNRRKPVRSDAKDDWPELPPPIPWEANINPTCTKGLILKPFFYV
jgi:hypothetical protein